MTDNTQLIQEIKEVIASEGMVDISKITPDATIESLDLKDRKSTRLNSSH